ncbi:MAG: hypothetical protein ACTSVY_04565 [Candidatus Helarchaeota archaeon]
MCFDDHVGINLWHHAIIRDGRKRDNEHAELHGGILMAQRQKKEKLFGFKGVKEKKNLLYGIAVIALIGGLVAALFFTGVFNFGSLFPGPSAPPKDQQVGYAVIQLYNPINDTYIGSSEIRLYGGYNETFIRTIENDTLIYLDNWTTAFVNVSGYHPTFVSLHGSGTDDPANPQINKINLYGKCNSSNLEFSLIAIDHEYGTYDNTSITDGYHVLTFQWKLNEPDRGSMFFGHSTSIPEDNSLVSADTFTANLSIWSVSNWIAFNGTVENITFLYMPYINPDPIDINIYNVTWGPSVLGTSTWEIAANFTNISGIYTYQGIIDGYHEIAGSI